jgi:hypothetical protein
MGSAAAARKTILQERTERQTPLKEKYPAFCRLCERTVFWGGKRFLKFFPGARYFQKTGLAVAAVPEVRSWGRARQDGKPAKEKEKYPAWGLQAVGIKVQAPQRLAMYPSFVRQN